MNILFFPSWYESEEWPSVSFFTEQVRALKSYGNHVTVALVDIINYPYKTEKKKFHIYEEIRDNVTVFRIKLPSYGTGKFPFIFYLYYKFFYRKLMDFIEKKGMVFDVIYAHSFWHSGYIGTYYKKKYNIPLIVQEHRSMLLTGEFSSNVNKYLKRTVEFSDAFYCVSNKLKENVEKRICIKNKVQVLPNMVDDIFSYRPLPENKKFIFSFIGTLNEGKRILFLLKAFEKLCENNSNVQLNIAGDGPLKNDVTDYISNSQLLKNTVNYCGYLNRTQVVDFIANSNAFVLPSAYETFGVVYIEAMAVGRPVIATKNGGANDIVDTENGFLIDIDDEEQLVSSMKKMIDEYNNFDLKKISFDCLNKYSNNAVMTKVIDKMKECIKNK